MCEQVSYKERKGGGQLLWPCVNQGHECETELYVCVWTASVKTTSCVWASQTGHVHIWWTHIHKHIRILAGVPTHPVAPNTPWPYLYSQQKHTYTQGHIYTQSKIHWNSTGGLTLTHMQKHTDRSHNQLIQQTGNKPLWSTEIKDLIEEYNRRRKKFIPLFWTSKDPACFNKPNFMKIQMNQESY